MTPCHSLGSVLSCNSFLTLTGSVYRFHIPMPPLCHGDAPVPTLAATVWCILNFFFFSALDLVYRSHIPIPPPCHRDAPSPAAVWYVFSFFFVFFFSASDLIYRLYLPIPAPSMAWCPACTLPVSTVMVSCFFFS